MEASGDLGRRIADLRQQLGLSREELAHRAGMDETYLMSLEHSPDASPSRAALWRLAAALDTTMAALTGAGFSAPQGRGEASPRAVLEHIDDGECSSLVAPGGVGRVVFLDGEVPVALPVNFRMLERSVVFRTAQSSKLASPSPPDPVSFEVDHVDDALREGWSVLLTGSVRQPADAQERQRLEGLGLQPWAGDGRDTFVLLESRKVTGRRIRAR